MNNNEWQRELNELKLSKQQKKSIVLNLKKPRKKVDWMYRLALPSFAVLALVVSILFLTDQQTVEMMRRSASPEQIKHDHSEHIKRFFIYGAGLVVLLIVNGVLLRYALIKTKRWQKGTIGRVKSWVQQYRLLYFMILIFGSVSMVALQILVITSELLMGICFFIMFQLLHLSILLLLCRNHTAEKGCPHCNTTFNKKEIRKIMGFVKMELSCPCCQKPLHTTKKTKQLNGWGAMLLNVVMFSSTFIGIPWYMSFPMIIAYAIFVLRAVFPIFVEFVEEEEFLY